MNKSHAPHARTLLARTLLTGALGAALMLGGCQRTATPAEAPLAGAAIGGPFTLTDQDGRMRTDSMFAGQYRLMYFGYSFCPDVCPVDLQHLMEGYRALAKQAPDKAAKLVPIFVSVDPARDTPAVLRQFVRAFDPRLVGLTGSEAEIKAVAKRYGIYFRKQDPQPGAAAGGYMVDHSRQATLFGPDGKPIALIPEEGGADAIAAELAKWIA